MEAAPLADGTAVAPLAKSDRGLRSLLLKYMLWDALVRPGEWHVAASFDSTRNAVWREAVAASLHRLSAAGVGGKPVLAVLQAPKELPVVALEAAAAAAEAGGGATVIAFEPIRPAAAALRAAAAENGARGSPHVLARLSRDASPMHAFFSEFAALRNFKLAILGTAG